MTKYVMYVGTHSENDLVIQGVGVSRIHARITWIDGHLMIKDLKSSQKTFVNGNPISRSPLQWSDRVKLGSYPLDLNLVKQKVQDLQQGQGSSPKAFYIGRDPDSDLCIQDLKVSSEHARIYWGPHGLEIEDFKSRGGIFINGQKLKISPFSLNEELTLGKIRVSKTDLHRALNSTGMLMPVDQDDSQRTIVSKNPGAQKKPIPTYLIPQQKTNTSGSNALEGPSTSLWEQIFPFIPHREVLVKSPYFIPAVATILTTLMLFSYIGAPGLFSDGKETYSKFVQVLAYYIGFMSMFVMYQVCQRQKSLWIFLVVGGITCAELFLTTLWFIRLFRSFLPASWLESKLFWERFYWHFVGAGMMEECMKIIPVVLIFFAMRGTSQESQRLYGVTGPSDGILLGAASGIAFTWVETLFIYVPNQLSALTFFGFTLPQGYLNGLQLMIPRILGTVTGHLAYSAILGYFVGLAIYYPKRAFVYLPVGYLISCILHACWNAGTQLDLFYIGFAVQAVTLLFLSGAIISARQYHYST